MSQVSPGMARLAAITALLGAAIVILSQIVTAYTLRNELDEVIATVNLIGKHGIVTLLFGLAAAGSLIYAVATGSRTATYIVVAAGVAVILTFLIVDLPDIGDTGLYDTPGAGNLDATSKGAAGLWLELTGGVILILSGLALSTLNAVQLKSIGPQRNEH